MRPTLLPGEWLLVDPEAFDAAPPEAGDLVLVPDPRRPSRLLVKRVAEVHDEGKELWVRGDDRDTSSDSDTFGPVATASVTGRPWLRYWPPRRIGRIG